MQIAHAVARVAALLTLASAPAVACSLAEGPWVGVLGSDHGKDSGHQPWIALDLVEKQKVSLVLVDAACVSDTVKRVPCKGTDVPYDREGDYLRPQMPLPDHARVQIVVGNQFYAELNVKTAPAAKALPAASASLKKVTVEDAAFTACRPGGPMVSLALKTGAKLDGTLLMLLYWDKPDPAHPEKGLRSVHELSDDQRKHGVELRNTMSGREMPDSLPTTLWVVFADSDGHVGSPIKILPRFTTADQTRFAEWQKQRDQ